MKWYDDPKLVRRKPNQLIVKRYDGEQFLGSCAFPSVMYPLNGDIEIFTEEKCSEITDTAVLDIINQQTYDIGRCYTNTERLVNALQEAGYNAQSYVGWLCFGNRQTPVHHCWAVLDGNVIDLADDYTVMLSGENGERITNSPNVEESRRRMAEFEVAAREVTQDQRCWPIGKPTGWLLYVGCPCDPMDGIRIYNKLMEAFPNHECRRGHNGTNLSYTQYIMAEYGLMDWAK